MESINLKPAQPVLYARHLEALIAAWLDSKKSKLDSITIAGYRSKIAHFVRWWQEIGPVQDWRLRESDLDVFSQWLLSTGLGYHSRRDVLRRLRQMLNWAYRHNHTQRNYSIWVPLAPGAPPLPRLPSLDSLYRLLVAARTPRDACLIALVLGTGIRRSECAFLRVADVTLYPDNSGLLTIRRPKRTAAPAADARIVAFDAATGKYLAAYLAGAGPLFPGGSGGFLRPESLSRIVRRLIQSAGVQSEIRGLHDLRRAFITYYRREHRGAAYDLSLRRQVGHLDDKTTDLYDLADPEIVRRDLISPLAIMRREGYDIFLPSCGERDMIYSCHHAERGI